MELFFLSLLLIFAGGAVALILQRFFNPMKAAASLLISVGCLLGLIHAGTWMARAGEAATLYSIQYLQAFTLAFRIDGLSAFFLIAIHLVSMLAAVYSFHYMDHAEKSLATAVNYFFFSLLIGSMALVVAADNMITFMLAWEIMSLSSFFLVIYNPGEAENRRAAYLYFVFSHVGAMFIFAAFGVVYAYSGTFAFAGVGAMPEAAKILALVFAFIGFGSKAGVFPFHVWLPHAHPAAPSHISAVMSGVMIKTGIYGILRMYGLIGFHGPVFGEIVLIAGIVSGILGVVYALGQHDLKRLLAYHSVENIGIILIGLGVGMIGAAADRPMMAMLGFAGGLLHVLNHAIFKSLLFLGAGGVLQQTGTRTMDALGGLLKNMKVTGTTFLAGSLAISGLPPLNGFVSEFFIYIGGFSGATPGGRPFISCMAAIVGLAIIGGLALACFTKVMGVVFQGEPRTDAARDVGEVGPAMRLPMIILAGACLVIGLFPTGFVLMAVEGVSALGLGYDPGELGTFIQITGNITRGGAVFFIVFFTILAMRKVLYRDKTVSRGGTWGCGFTQPTPRMQYTASSYAGSILEFFRPVAPLHETHPPIKGRFPDRTHYHSHVDDIAEKGMTPGVVRPVLFLFDKLRWIQHGDIHLYIGYILLAIVALLFFV
jgi:hydrogenase-4 component B